MPQSENKKAGPHGATKILVDYFCFTVSLSEFQEHDETEEKAVYLPQRIEKKFYLSGLEFQDRRGMYGYAYARWYDASSTPMAAATRSIYRCPAPAAARGKPRTGPDVGKVDSILAIYLRVAAHKSLGYCLRYLWQVEAENRARLHPRRTVYLPLENVPDTGRFRRNGGHLGSSKSDFRLRIYDKTLERQVKGSVDADKSRKNWVRCEFQLRNDAAASFIRSWQSNGSIGLTFMGIMKNQLLYVSQYDGKNRDRATVAPWWARLLGDAEQIRMAYDAGKDYNFDSLKRYIFHQAGSSIKAYLAIMDGDFGPLLQGVRMAALNDRQTELIRSAQEQRREWQQRQIEYNKM